MESNQHLIAANFKRTRRDEAAAIHDYVEYGEN